MPNSSMAFLCLLTVHLHLPANADLKGKRKEVKSLKAQLAQRFGVSVAETGHHDLWQRATLSVALVARDRSGAEEQADAVERFTASRFGDWVGFDRRMVSDTDLEDH